MSGVILIIAYGNSLRRDDGAGLLLGERLEQIWRERQRDVERIAVHQLTPELALSIADERVEAVVFVDTRVITHGIDSVALEVRPVDSEDLSPSVGHHMDPAVVMAYARLLYGKEAPAWLVTVPGVDFEHGEGVSETAQSALDTLSEMLLALPEDWPMSPQSLPSD